MREGESYNEKDDRELVQAYLDGEEDILPYLIKRHIKAVYNFAHSFTSDEAIAEDITQEVFVKVWKKLKSYNPKYSFKTWLFTIARNTAFDYLRKKKDLNFSDFETVDGSNALTDNLTDEAVSAEEDLIKIENIEYVRQGISKVPLLYREVLILRYNHDLSLDEISTVLKRPLETVKSQYRRGLLHLKTLLTRIN
jgi:RNA polymerase sigma-70 factor (ECF subfamily)